MKYLFISYTGILEILGKGQLGEDDLRQGLFYLDCSRESFFFGSLPCGPSPQEVQEAALAYMRLEQAVLTAEAEKRLEWRVERARADYNQLNPLLVQHGLKPLQLKGTATDSGLKQQMLKTNPGVAVFY